MIPDGYKPNGSTAIENARGDVIAWTKHGGKWVFEVSYKRGGNTYRYFGFKSLDEARAKVEGLSQ